MVSLVLQIALFGFRLCSLATYVVATASTSDVPRQQTDQEITHPIELDILVRPPDIVKRKRLLSVISSPSAVAWGALRCGGDTGDTDLTNVVDISCGGCACAARKKDGTAVVWGDPKYGGGFFL